MAITVLLYDNYNDVLFNIKKKQLNKPLKLKNNLLLVVVVSQDRVGLQMLGLLHKTVRS